MKFKHGQKVKCEIENLGIVNKITDAKISINENGKPFICHNNINCDGLLAEDKLGYKYSWALRNDFIGYGVYNLRPAEKSFDYPEIGDEYKDSRGNSSFVLGVCGRVIFLSSYDDKDYYSFGYTKEELIKDRYTIVQNEDEDEDEDEDEAEQHIKALEKLGRIKDGKILN